MSDKTIIGLADKSLDYAAMGAGKLASAIEQIGRAVAESSPHVWNKLVQWHRVDAFGELLVLGSQVLGCLTMSWVFWSVFSYGGLKKLAAVEFATESKEQCEKVTSAEQDTKKKSSAHSGLFGGLFYHRSDAERARDEKLRLANGAKENGDLYRVWGLVGIVAVSLLTGLIITSLPGKMANYAVPEKAAAVELIMMARGAR